MRCALLVFAAACTTPAPSSLKPTVDATLDTTGLYVFADLGAGDPDVDVRVTFRGETYATADHDNGTHTVLLKLDTPLASDEPLVVDVDGIAVTMTAPTAFDTLDVPLFISRSHDTSVTWSPASLLFASTP